MTTSSGRIAISSWLAADSQPVSEVGSSRSSEGFHGLGWTRATSSRFCSSSVSGRSWKRDGRAGSGAGVAGVAGASDESGVADAGLGRRSVGGLLGGIGTGSALADRGRLGSRRFGRHGRLLGVRIERHGVGSRRARREDSPARPEFVTTRQLRIVFVPSVIVAGAAYAWIEIPGPPTVPSRTGLPTSTT